MRRTDGGTSAAEVQLQRRPTVGNAGAVAPGCTVLCKLGRLVDSGMRTSRDQAWIDDGWMSRWIGGLVDW